MKRQIRKGVFETNSSTQHAICIKRVEDPEKIIALLKEQGDVFTVPSNDSVSWYDNLTRKSVIDLSGFNFIEKLDILVASSLANYERDGFLGSLSMIQEALAESGVKLIVDFEKLLKLHDNYYWDDGLYGSVNDMIGRSNIFDFLFSDDCVHTSWCDECCGEPDDNIKAAWKRFDDMPKNEKIIMQDRR